MPIVGVTDRNMRLTTVGVLRKGGEKTAANKPGPDLKYFRLQTTDPVLIRKFQKSYGMEPEQVNVYFPFEKPEDNLTAWLEVWNARQQLVLRGDGEKLVKRLMPDGSHSFEQVPHPRDDKGVPVGKPYMRMNVWVPELETMGTIMVLSNSWNDVREITALLAGFYEQFGTLKGIPFILSRADRRITRPGQPGGPRLTQVKSLLSIATAPEWTAEYFRSVVATSPIDIVANAQASPSPAVRMDMVDEEDVAQYIDEETGEIIDGGPEAGIDLEADVDLETESEPVPLDAYGHAKTADELKALLVATSMDYDEEPDGAIAQQRLYDLRDKLLVATGGSKPKASAVTKFLWGNLTTNMTEAQISATLDWLSEDIDRVKAQVGQIVAAAKAEK